MSIIYFPKSLRSLVTEKQSLYAPDILCLPCTEHETVNLRALGNHGSFGIELYKGRKLLITYMKREINSAGPKAGSLGSRRFEVCFQLI